MDDLEISQKAAEDVRAERRKAIEKHGPSVKTTLIRLKQAMNAKEVKVFNAQGILVYSDKLVAHGTRLQAVKLAMEMHELFPSQKHDHTHKGSVSLSEVSAALRKVKDGGDSSES